jgi:tetratricopeptide (TPR) repeat protein
MKHATIALALTLAVFSHETPAAPLMSRAPALAVCGSHQTPAPICEAPLASLIADRRELRSLNTLFPFDRSAPCPAGVSPSWPGPEITKKALPLCALYVAAQPPGSPAFATALAQQSLLQYYDGLFSDPKHGAEPAAKDALANIERALAIDPDNLVALLAKVTLLEMSSSDADSSKDIEHLRALYPDDPRVRSKYVNLMRLMGTPEQALAAIDSALELLPDEDSLHSDRADFLTRLGRTDEALVELDLAVDLEPMNSFALFKRSELELARDNAKAALADAERARALHYPPADAEFVIARAHLLLGNLDKALAAVTEAEANFTPQYETPLLALYRFAILDRLGRKQEAEAALAGLAGERNEHILKIQVFLRNMGFDVPISGTFDETTRRELAACLAKGACSETMAQAI